MGVKQVIVIGGGLAGMSSAAYLAKEGYSVKIIEKNHTLGGRCRVLEHQGFKFDIGPSWYWMPDVFDSFFNDFNHTTQDFYNLIQLDPGFEIVFDDDKISVPADISGLYKIFETIEKGSGDKLKKFMQEAEIKYKIAIHDIVYKPFISYTEILDSRLIGNLVKMSLFTSMSKYVRRYFKNKKLIRLMEFPVIFLGAMPGDIPALYSMMNYAAFQLGTWYPQGGMFEIVRAIQEILNKLQVDIHTNEEVLELVIRNKHVERVITTMGEYHADIVIAAADYHFVDRVLLGDKYSNYTTKYWEKRLMAPSALLFFIGLNRSIPALSHHTLFYDADVEQHAKDLYESPKWPDNPLFYLSCTSKTDKTVAPAGSENIVILIPVASGINDNPEKQDYYFNNITQRIRNYININISDHVIFKETYSISNFIEDYHSFKGNAYGLANTLFQTAIMKPSMLNRNVLNMVYTGQLTVPGPGVPPALISGKIAANLVQYKLKI